MFFSKRKLRGFHYQPRYTKEGDKIERRAQFDFSRTVSSSAGTRKTLIMFIVLLVLVVYLIMFFKRLEQKRPEEPIQVESIEIK